MYHVTHPTSPRSFSCPQCADGRDAPECLCLHEAADYARSLPPRAELSRNGVVLLYTGERIRVRPILMSPQVARRFMGAA